MQTMPNRKKTGRTPRVESGQNILNLILKLHWKRQTRVCILSILTESKQYPSGLHPTGTALFIGTYWLLNINSYFMVL